MSSTNKYEDKEPQGYSEDGVYPTSSVERTSGEETTPSFTDASLHSRNQPNYQPEPDYMTDQTEYDQQQYRDDQQQYQGQHGYDQQNYVEVSQPGYSQQYDQDMYGNQQYDQEVPYDSNQESSYDPHQQVYDEYAGYEGTGYKSSHVYDQNEDYDVELDDIEPQSMDRTDPNRRPYGSTGLRRISTVQEEYGYPNGSAHGFPDTEFTQDFDAQEQVDYGRSGFEDPDVFNGEFAAKDGYSQDEYEQKPGYSDEYGQEKYPDEYQQKDEEPFVNPDGFVDEFQSKEGYSHDEYKEGYPNEYEHTDDWEHVDQVNHEYDQYEGTEQDYHTDTQDYHQDTQDYHDDIQPCSSGEKFGQEATEPTITPAEVENYEAQLAATGRRYDSRPDVFEGFDHTSFDKINEMVVEQNQAYQDYNHQE